MTTELPLLSSPAHGVPPVIDSIDHFRGSLLDISAVKGPVAIDAERASGIRYGQRAFLVQLRREGAGTFLLDSEALGDLSGLNAAIDGAEWVIHSVTQDLPCLQERGMRPSQLFDTELAARLLGWEKFGLGSVAEETLGLRLAKEHSAADWSRRPLPEEWLNYAALDVEVLLPIRDILHQKLIEAGKWEYARQEFDHLLDFTPKHYAEPWRRTSGLAKVKSRKELARIKELWSARDTLAATEDIAPSKVLRDRELVALASSRVRSSDDIMSRWPKIPRSTSARLFRALRKADRLPLEELPPRRESTRTGEPPFSRTEIKERVSALKETITEVSAEHEIPHDVLLQPAIVKSLGAEGVPVEVADYLKSRGARPWQIELCAPALETTLGTLPEA